MARKPLAGTVAANVLTHGTGALNIDGCRVPGDGAPLVRSVSGGGSFRFDGFTTLAELEAAAACGDRTPTGRDAAATLARYQAFQDAERVEPTGRWPSNVVLSHVMAWDGADACADGCVPGCPVAELDRQSGVLTSGANPTRRGSDKFQDAYGDFSGQAECTPARGTDSGGASRFFPTFRYSAKAPTAERPRGDDGTAHPTVKPIDLMRWLVRLVTPSGGTVLEPFAGSGTTAEACVIEGMRCIAIEREAAYLPLIVGRLAKPLQPVLDLFPGGVQLPIGGQA